MLFDGPPAELPIATLTPNVARSRRGRLVGDLDRWVSARWAWVQPRTLPLLAAFVGFLATLGAVKAVGAWSLGKPQALSVHARITDGPPGSHIIDPASCPASWRVRGVSVQPVRFVINPLGPADRYIELTIDEPDPR